MSFDRSHLILPGCIFGASIVVYLLASDPSTAKFVQHPPVIASQGALTTIPARVQPSMVRVASPLLASKMNSMQDSAHEGASMSTQAFAALAAPVLATITGLAYLLGRSQKPQLAIAASVGKQVDFPSYMQVNIGKSRAPLLLSAAATSSSDVSDKIDLDNLVPSELETMYIDALWAFYTEGKAIMTDEQFAKLKDELNWQGSGFPTLHREEIEFVKAVLAFAQGNPILSNEEYDKLKERIKGKGKRRDVTAFLLMVKGKQLLDPEKFEQLRGQMKAAGVSASADSITRTLSDTPNTLQYQVTDVLYMYSALGLVPTALCASAWGFLGFLLGGLQGIQTVATVGFPIIGASSFLLTREMIRYLDLTGPKLVKGVCPCCETPIEASFFDCTPAQKVEKCPNCGTLSNLDSEKMLIKDAAGFSFIGEGADQKKTVDQYLSWASGVTSGILVGKNPVSQLGGRKSDDKQPKPESVMELVQEEIKVGIFAWAILLGYGIFGEQFVSRARGKGIAIHSGVINDFCKRFNIPNGLRQKYIQTAKRNGHDLGFLVDGCGLIGDGLFGKQAMAWWKAQGW